MKGSIFDFESLHFSVVSEGSSDETVHLIQFKGFFDNINVAMGAMKWMWSQLPLQFQGQLAL